MIEELFCGLDGIASSQGSEAAQWVALQTYKPLVGRIVLAYRKLRIEIWNFLCPGLLPLRLRQNFGGFGSGPMGWPCNSKRLTPTALVLSYNAFPLKICLNYRDCFLGPAAKAAQWGCPANLQATCRPDCLSK